MWPRARFDRRLPPSVPAHVRASASEMATRCLFCPRGKKPRRKYDCGERAAGRPQTSSTPVCGRRRMDERTPLPRWMKDCRVTHVVVLARELERRRNQKTVLKGAGPTQSANVDVCLAKASARDFSWTSLPCSTEMRKTQAGLGFRLVVRASAFETFFSPVLCLGKWRGRVRCGQLKYSSGCIWHILLCTSPSR